MTDQLSLRPGDRERIEALLRHYLPNIEVWAYGSRVNGRSHDASDLDLVLRGAELEPIAESSFTDLVDAFEESDIPILIDVHDWARLPESFHQDIEHNYVVLQEGATYGGWRKTTLGDCAQLVRDTVAPTDCGDIPYIGLEHIGEDTLQLVGTGMASDVTSAKSRFKRGDILFGKLRPYFRKVVRARFDGICSTDIWVVRPAEDIDPGWLFYLMASQQFVDNATLGSQGTRMPRAKWEHVSRYPVRIPPLDEQRRIAHILGTLDDKIELNRRMSETLEAMAQALFKSWFIDFDPVRAKAKGRPTGLPPALEDLFPDKLQDSELGEIPEGWTVGSLDEIATFTNGLALQRFPPTGEDWLPVIKIAEMRRGYSERTAKASPDIDPKYTIEDGDLLFSWSGSLDLTLWSHGRGALNQHLFKVTSNDFPQWFYWGWLRQHLDDFRSIAVGKATTMGHIQRHHLTDAKVVMPSDAALSTADAALGWLLSQRLACATQDRTLAKLRDIAVDQLIGDFDVNA